MEIIKKYFSGDLFCAKLKNNNSFLNVVLDIDEKGEFFREFVFKSKENYEKRILNRIDLPKEIEKELIRVYRKFEFDNIARQDKDFKRSQRKDWWI